MPLDLKDRGHAIENEYFHHKEQELIAKMKKKLAAEGTVKLEMQCPKCEGTLHATEFEEVRVDVCDTCHGVWLNSGALARILHNENQQTGWFERWFRLDR
jgi:ribosomal protein L31